MTEEFKTRRTFDLPFADFDYETPAAKYYGLHTHRRSPLELLVVGYAADIEKFAIDFSFEVA